MHDPADTSSPLSDPRGAGPGAGSPVGGAAPAPREGFHELTVDPASFLPDGTELVAPPAGAEALEGEDLDRLETDLAAVEAALEAIDGGTYGTCRACGGPIPDADLEASPVRTACATHE